MAGIVVIFDFDSTIIECDSDNWVLDETGLTEKFYQLLPSMAWNPLMVFIYFCALRITIFLKLIFFSCLGYNFLFLKHCCRIR